MLYLGATASSTIIGTSLAVWTLEDNKWKTWTSPTCKRTTTTQAFFLKLILYLQQRKWSQRTPLFSQLWQQHLLRLLAVVVLETREEVKVVMLLEKVWVWVRKWNGVRCFQRLIILILQFRTIKSMVVHPASWTKRRQRIHRRKIWCFCRRRHCRFLLLPKVHLHLLLLIIATPPPIDH